MSRYLPDDWTLPLVNEVNRPFFTTGKLMVQRCRRCGQVQHPPLDMCRQCQDLDLDYEEASGTGTISSYTVVHRSADRRLDPALPYNVVVVALDDHPEVKVVGNVVNDTGGDLSAGAAVHVTFAEVFDQDTRDLLKLPQWELT